jgi:predicted dehydrogenase
MVLNYRMNAGYIPLDHWVQTGEGGGRNLGEACHIYDLFTYLTDARIAQVHASGIRPSTGHYKAQDNFSATLTFTDGSVATLTYTALGSKDFAKEQLDVFVDGKVIHLDDYKSLTIAGARGRGLRTRVPEKGQREELASLATAIQAGGDWPIPLWHQEQATRISFEVERQLNRGL